MTKRALKAKRSAAARKGWETRRARAKVRFIWEDSAAAKQRLLQRPMLAADLGIEPKWWSVTINADSWKDIDWGKEEADRIRRMRSLAERAVARLDDPNPWPRLAAKVRRWWQRATQWWRQ